MEWYSAADYVFASGCKILLFRFVSAFQQERKLRHLSHGPRIHSWSLWNENSHYFWLLHTKPQLSGASTFLKPFSACHPPTATSSSPTESRVGTDGADPLLLHLVRMSRWASTSTSSQITKQPCREGLEAPFLFLLQRISFYPNTRRHTVFSLSCFSRRGSCFSKRHHIFWHYLH